MQNQQSREMPGIQPQDISNQDFLCRPWKPSSGSLFGDMSSQLTSNEEAIQHMSEEFYQQLSSARGAHNQVHANGQSFAASATAPFNAEGQAGCSAGNSNGLTEANSLCESIYPPFDAQSFTDYMTNATLSSNFSMPQFSDTWSEAECKSELSCTTDGSESSRNVEAEILALSEQHRKELAAKDQLYQTQLRNLQQQLTRSQEERKQLEAWWYNLIYDLCAQVEVNRALLRDYVDPSVYLGSAYCKPVHEVTRGLPIQPLRLPFNLIGELQRYISQLPKPRAAQPIQIIRAADVIGPHRLQPGRHGFLYSINPHLAFRASRSTAVTPNTLVRGAMKNLFDSLFRPLIANIPTSAVNVWVESGVEGQGVPGTVEYLGLYMIYPTNESLPLSEWRALPEHVQDTIIVLTCQKTGDFPSTVKARVEEGSHLIPRYALMYIGAEPRTMAAYAVTVRTQLSSGSS